MANNLDFSEFLSLSFSHHMEILLKTSTLEERAFYIHQSILNHWDKYTLREYLKADFYHHQGKMPNNFSLTLPKTLHARKVKSRLARRRTAVESNASQQMIPPPSQN